ncbi:MAG TPA: rhomboid family intramembrane serine protease [Solirubrobacteraceae bacterium]|jgi:membrane associated rhomboid family serine protease|nr:rhomboid family intramembrane serine protease [Solirubrobacteraceae bacterium]
MFPLKDNIPNQRFPFVTIALVVINVIVYLLSIRNGGSFFGGPSTTTVVHDAAIPYDLAHPGKYCTVVPVPDEFGRLALESKCRNGPFPGQIPTWESVFASMFMHGGFLHIAGNMLFLAIFGPNVEGPLGYFRFILFYLLGGVIALAAQTAVDPNSMVPTLGASGAIAAVLGGYIVLYPRARILTLVFIIFFVTIIEVPAVFLLGFWFLEQIYFGAGGLAQPTGGGGGVAYFAHVGGFLFGLAAIRLLVRRPPSEPPRIPVY